MFRIGTGTNRQLVFAVGDIAGSWRSREGAPSVRIYHNQARKGGGYYVEFAYDEKTVFRRPIKSYWGDIRHFDLYGFIGLAYDAEGDVLRLSLYGDYYRAED